MDEAAQFARNGYVVFDRIFDPAFIDELRAEYLRQYADVASAPDRYRVGKRRLQVPVQLTGPYLSPTLYANPALLEVVSAALGDDYLIESVAVVTALTGAAVQHLHRDHEDLFPGHPFTRAVMGSYGITVAIPLVDLTPETGTTKLFTESHVKPRDDERFELPYIERGRSYAMDYRLWHQGTENRSAVERPIIYLVYSRAWFTDIWNYGNADRIRISAADLAAVPAQHRALFRRLSLERAAPAGRADDRGTRTQ
jgi:ectoine hydroxylase-related dioxygenase (phytanoyl-CoA dioxygenase family)